MVENLTRENAELVGKVRYYIVEQCAEAVVADAQVVLFCGHIFTSTCLSLGLSLSPSNLLLFS